MLPGIRRSRQARVIPHAPRWRRFCRLVSICHPERSEGSAVEGCRHICVPKCRFLALLVMTFLFRTAFFHCVWHNSSPMDPKHRSRGITDGRDRAGARAMFKAVGFTDSDLRKPIIGVANTWIETMPCNFHLRRLAAKVKEGIRAAGGTPMEFNTIAISDGITMGTEGMKTSLVSREVIADSIELVARGHMFDALVVLVGCDKTIPAGAMALLRIDVPGFVVYGGSIQPGRFQGRDATIQDLFEAVGAHAAGKMSDRG